MHTDLLFEEVAEVSKMKKHEQAYCKSTKQIVSVH